MQDTGKKRNEGRDTIARPEGWTKRAPDKGTVAAGERMKEGALERSGMLAVVVQKEVRKNLKPYFDAKDPKAQVALEKAVQNLTSDIVANIRQIETTPGPSGNSEKLTAPEMRAMTEASIEQYIITNNMEPRADAFDSDDSAAAK
jgi:hypothetical protein